jgi:hypothetical protein
LKEAAFNAPTDGTYEDIISIQRVSCGESRQLYASCAIDLVSIVQFRMALFFFQKDQQI